ncbi:MAG: disaggregatase related repeat-containing protein [Halobacteriota archaeon]
MKRNRKQRRTGSLDKGIACMGILILLVTGISVASATTITVQPGESIQDAINNLPAEGGIIELAAGVHDITNTIIIDKSNVIITGTHASILKSNFVGDFFNIPHLNPAAGDDWNSIGQKDNITFSNFTVETNNNSRRLFIRAWHVTNFTVENIKCSGYSSLVAINPTGGATTARTEDLIIRNNVIEHGNLAFYYTTHAIVKNNILKDHSGCYGLHSDRNNAEIVIEDNYIENCGANGALTVDTGSKFTIRNNTIIGSQRGIFVEMSQTDSVISDNTITGTTMAGIYLRPQFTIKNFTIRNNLIYSNAGDGMQAIDIGYNQVYGTNVSMVNNVIYNNNGDGIYMNSDYYEILGLKNNIIINNGGYGINHVKGNISHSYNNIENNTQGNYFNALEGTGEIHEDPLFADPANGDFHLKSTVERWDGSKWLTDSEHSPCIDAGDPSSDYFNEPDYPDGHINMGAYGNTVEASKGTPAGPDITSPYTSGHNPAKNATGVAKDTNIVVHIKDDGDGVDQSSIVMKVEGTTVTPTITGTANDYTLTYDPASDFSYSQVVDVTIDAQDLASPANNMTQDSYSFTIESETTGVWSSGWESKKALVIGDWPSAYYDNLYPHITYNLRNDGKWVLITGTDVNNGVFGYYYDEGINEWVKDTALVSGLTAGWHEYPALVYNLTGDNKWTLITRASKFHGYYWDGTKWVEDSSRVVGLPDISGRASHTFIEDLTGDGKLTLLTGTEDGTFRAFYWDGTGTQWLEDSLRVNGLPDVGQRSVVTAGFNIFGDNRWNVIAGSIYSTSLRVFYWDGSQWIEDTTKASGLNSNMPYLVPTLGYNVTGNGKWALITGTGQYETLLGWYYNTVDTTSMPSQTTITSYHPLATTVRISFSYPHTWNHRVKYSTNADMSDALWSDWFEDVDEVDVKLTRLTASTTYYYEIYTYIPWDASYYVKSSVNSFTTLSSQNPVTVQPGDSIQDAIEMLPLEGGTVELAAGVHDVHNTIVIYMNNITIQGTHTSEIRSCDSKKDVFIIPHENPSPEENWGNIPILENLTFKGFKVTSSYAGSGGSLVHAWNVNNITVEDILDESQLGNLIAINPTGGGSSASAKDVFIRNNYLFHSSIVFCFSENIHVINNTLTDVSGGAGIDINRNNKYVYIYDNYVYGGYNYNIRGHGGSYVYIYNNMLIGAGALNCIWNDGLSHVIIKNNTITGASWEAILIEPQWARRNVTIINNRIHSNTGHGIRTTRYTYGFQDQMSDVAVINNVIYNNSGDGIKMGTEWVQLNISNNIIANNSGYGINYMETIEPTTISYNDVWQNALGDYNNTSAGKGDIETNPLFVDADNGDFHLADSSPCIDAGVPYEEDPVYGVYVNEPVPNGGRVNMGAYGNTAEAALSPGAATGTTSGNVTDTNGTAIGNATLTDGTRFATTNETGRYRIANVPVGIYTVIASAEGYENATKNATVVANETTVVIFTLNPVGDALPPITNATIIPALNDAGWNNVTPVTVMFFCNDTGGSGVSYTNLSSPDEITVEIEGFNYTIPKKGESNLTIPLNATYGDSFNVTVNNEGVTEIWYYSVDNNTNVESAKNVTLRIDTAPPVISNVTVPDITGSSATITWTTDEPADSQVEYGWDTNYGLTTSLDTSRVTNHSVLVTGLSTNTTYHYRAKSKDAADNFAVSEDYNFTTPGATITITDAIDNRLRSSTPNVVLNDTVWIDAGRLSPDTNYRGVIWFNLSQLNSTDIIKSAKLSLFWYYEYHNKSTNVEIYRPVDWAENYVNWNNRTNGVAWNRPGGDWYDRNNVAQGNMPYDAVTFPYGAPDNAYYEFDVTDLVQGYVNGTYDNTGFFIKANEVGDSYIAFRSSDWGNAIERPKLVVSYSRGSSSEDGTSPLVTNPTATPAAILMDNGRPRIPGTNISQLNVTVTDNTGVDAVTIDLSPIGGSPAAPMTNIPGTDIWTITTNATAGINLTPNLAVTATDTSGNSDSSVSISLTVLRRGDVDRDNDVDIMDSLEIAKYTVGNAPDPGMFIADVDPATGDGIVDVMDALYIAKYTVRNADEV